jgi:hypothetical protein
MMSRKQNVDGLAVLGALLLAVASSPAASVPHSESFESYALGYSIHNAADWSGANGAGVVTNATTAITALTAYTNAGNAFPLPGATHEQVLGLSGALTNSVGSATGGVVTADWLVMPAQCYSEPAGSTNAKFACWVNTNDQFVIWHRDVAGGSNAWITLAGTSIETGTWVRITVVQDYANSRYQVSLNGGSALTDARGWDAANGGSHPGAWFDMVNTNGYASRFRTEDTDTAYLDDLVFTNRSLSYSTTGIGEHADNNGTIDNSTPLVITLAADTFTGSNGNDFVADGKLLTSNVPAGLSVVAERTGDATLSVTLTGTATAHGAAASITNLTFTLADAAFAFGQAADVTGYARDDLSVTFFDTPSLAYSTTSFTESSANDGSMAAGATLTVQARTWAGTNGTEYVGSGAITVSGVPDGLNATVTKVNSAVASVVFSGNANPHTSGQDTDSMTLVVNDAAFVEGNAAAVPGYSNGTLSVSFYDPFVLTYSRTAFAELSQGLIDNTDPLVITLSNDTFSAGTEFVGEGKLVVANLPDNLAAVATRTSDTTLSVTLTGTALNHTPPADNVTELTFTFQGSAFAHAEATAVTNYLKNDLAINYSETAVTINPVPYRESFEDYSDGYALVGTNGWQSDAADAGTVTTETAIVSALTGSGIEFPLTTNHTKVLRMSAEITDEIKSGSGGTVYTDTMLYITARESAPAGSTDYQFAFFVNTNQQPVVWHRDTSGTPTNTWTTLASAPTVATGAWHRVTVVQDFAAGKFQMMLDGNKTPLANPTSGDDWFNMVGTANPYMSRLRILGGDADVPSYLDDLVVDTEVPAFLAAPSGTLFRFR